MYPNLYFAIRDWFGVEVNALKIFYTFGIFVALSFIAAAVVLSRELKRKEKQGLLAPREEVITVGKPASLMDLLISGLIGFIFGYKLIGAYLATRSGNIDLQEYIFSLDGSLAGGAVLCGIMLYLKYREKSKQKLPKPEQRIIRIWPHDRVGDMVIFALVFGIFGAKLFDNFENWDRFIKNPIGNLLSPSGLTFYGGLICAAVAVCWYATRKGIKFWHLVDAAAPALMIAYAIGRIGCQVSGDGDWGIYNSGYISDRPGHVIPAQAGAFEKNLHIYSLYFTRGQAVNPDSTISNVSDRYAPSLTDVVHKSFRGPSFMPAWIFAYTYPNNVNEDGMLLPACEGKYCRVLPQPVFPTPLYETIMCSVLFLFLWFMRKRINTPGIMFSIYLILTGTERFLIELIRVNTTYDILGFHPTQAEIISVLLILTGIIMIIYLRGKKSAISADVV